MCVCVCVYVCMCVYSACVCGVCVSTVAYVSPDPSLKRSVLSVSRYVGDMLAWLHQATASEKEHLDALLKQVTVRGTQMSNGHLQSS